MKLVDLSNPIALATIIANSNANSIPVNATGTAYASQAEGFPHITMIPEDNGGEAPHGLDFNGFLKMLSSHVFNIQNGSPETFNPAVSTLIGGYPKNAQLWLIDDNNSRLLKSTKDDNTDNFLTTPSVIGTSWVDAFPTKDYVDNNFVTKATAQTITGGKTFQGNLDKQNKEADKGETANNRYWSISCYDKNGTAATNRLSMWQTQITSAGTETALYAYKNESGTNTYTSLKVIYPASGSPYATAPAPSLASGASGYGDQIVTVSWINTQLATIQTQINAKAEDSAVVKLTGNQTIGGTKTFSSTIHGSINGNAATVTNGVYTTGSQSIAGKKTFTNVPYIAMTHPSIHEQKTELTKGTAPTSDQDTGGGISFVDKDDKILADVLFFYNTDKDTGVRLRPHKANASGDTAIANLGIIYPASGNPYTECPASDKADSIVTTKAISKAAKGYVQLGNGIIINWGAATESTRTVNFAKTFPTKCCSVVGTCTYTGETSAGHGYVTDITTSSFRYTGVDNDMQPFQWIAIGY